MIYNGEKLRRIRLNSGLSLRKMGDLLGTSDRTIHNWEVDISTPPKMILNSYIQLDKKLKEYKSLENQPPINQTLRNLLIAGGITAFLVWLYKED